MINEIQIADTYLLREKEYDIIMNGFLSQSEIMSVAYKYHIDGDVVTKIINAVSEALENTSAALLARHLIEHPERFNTKQEVDSDEGLIKPPISIDDFCISEKIYENVIDSFVENTNIKGLRESGKLSDEEIEKFVDNCSDAIKETAKAIFSAIERRNPGISEQLAQGLAVKDVFNFEITDDEITQVANETLMRKSFADIGSRYGLDTDTINALKEDIKYAILTSNHIIVKRFISPEQIQKQVMHHIMHTASKNIITDLLDTIEKIKENAAEDVKR